MPERIYLGSRRTGPLFDPLCDIGQGNAVLRRSNLPRYARGSVFHQAGQHCFLFGRPDEPWEYCWVGFNGTEADRLVGLTDFAKGVPVIHYTNHDHLKRLLLNIYNSHGNNPSNEMKMSGFLYLFLSELVSSNELHAAGQYSSERSYLEKAMRFIQRNYCEMISVDGIAEFAGISRSHLYRVFMKNTGMSPNEYLSAYRINKACGLLRNSGLKINEIASSVGFQDQLYFSRVFKKMKGVSPSGYLKQFQRETKETQ